MFYGLHRKDIWPECFVEEEKNLVKMSGSQFKIQ